jgi:hypothetical protein
MVTLNGYDFDYYEEFNSRGIDNYGYVDFYKNNEMIIRVYVDYFEVDTEYDDSPSSFNSNTGSVGYSSYSYDVVSDVEVYTEFTDTDDNIYTEEQFLENNPEINDLDLIVEQAEEQTKRLFKDWWENQ